MPGTERTTDSVAFLFETEQLTDDQIERVKNFINRELAAQLKIASYEVRAKRFNSDHGGVVIYQP